MTSLVLGDGPVSFNIAPRSNDGVDFSSREAATNGPQLVVEPESDPGPVVRESVATAEITEATSVTVGRPAGAAPGDVLVACVTINGGVTSMATAGWTQFAEVTTHTNPKVYGYYRVVETSEPETWTWRLANRRRDLGSPYNPAGSYKPAASVGIARYSGVQLVDEQLSYDTYRATPLDGSPVKGSGPTLRGPTTTAAGSKLVGCMGINSGSHDVTITEPAGMDPAWNLGAKRQQLSDIDLGAAGQSPDRTWELNSPRESAGWLIALRAG